MMSGKGMGWRMRGRKKFINNPSSSGVRIERNIISFTESKCYAFCIDQNISEGIMKMLDICFI
jgi:hypothetical protein